MAQFTQGPWHVRGSSKQGYSQVADDQGEVICTTHGPAHKANAALIAVAPELYDLLIDLLKAPGPGKDGGSRDRLLTNHYGRRVRVLLAKGRHQ
jgi:hypothetical protein